MRLSTLLAALLLAGCDVNITPKQAAAAASLCDSNGGIASSYINVETSAKWAQFRAECRDGKGVHSRVQD